MVGQPETRVEAQARAGHLFDKLDLNHDGKLDQADRAIRTSEMFDRLDTNHDGVISRSEFMAAHDHMMGPERAGPDHAGPDHAGLDHAGLGRAGPGHGHAENPGMVHPGMDDGRPGGPMGHWGEGHHDMGGLVMLILQRADPGHSGTISRDAFVAAALSLFDQADANHDHVLTPAEQQAFAQAMHQHMRAHEDQHGGPGGEMPPTPSH